MVEYIEREAAIKPLRRWQKIIVKNYGKNDEYAKCLEDAIDKLIDIPTADVRPVRNGRWSREKNCETGYEIWVNVCSACGAITPVNVSRYKYCPRCGAKMDKEG